MKLINDQMKKYDKYTFFYRTRNPFSNWHSSNFKDENGIEYNCSEQYMMYQKAILFGDTEAAEDILSAKQPRDQKDIGRRVRNFDTKIWVSKAKQIVFDGCKLKFSQNPSMKKELMKTKGTLLVEASPYDRIWGIGLGEDDPAIHDPLNWNGLNWLGEVLTDLREYFEAND
jgi:ribA/ribD-fused uncharacterized protein